MEKVSEFIERNLASFILTCFGLLVPGGLVLAIFNMDYYVELNIIKLLFLSFIISAPTFGYLFLISIMSDINGNVYKNGDLQLSIAAIFNLVFFTSAVLAKLFFGVIIDKKKFVIIISIECLFFAIFFIKDIVENLRSVEITRNEAEKMYKKIE